MGPLKEKASSLLGQQNFDSLAVGVVDFAKNSFKGFEFYEGEESSEFHFFDLASLTKPLTLTLSYLKGQESFDRDMHLLLGHRGGLPAYGKLSRRDWRKEILSFSIEESPVEYSDYGALRLMLEWEAKTGQKFSEAFREDWDSGVVFWKELEGPHTCPSTGMREGRELRGEVHDPNAYIIGEFCSHAGLFATLPGVCQTLLNINERYQMIEKVQRGMEGLGEDERFIFGLDRVRDPETGLAGRGCSGETFGHLGFTGTSFWIDPKLMRGHIILSNATQHHWYGRVELNRLRKELGELAFTC